MRANKNMNDFTKDELKLLGGCVFSQYVSSLRDSTINHLQDDLKKLRGKIEEMIDNYCEHEEKETIQTSFAKSVFENRCKKCRRYV